MGKNRQWYMIIMLMGMTVKGLDGTGKVTDIKKCSENYREKE